MALTDMGNPTITELVLLWSKPLSGNPSIIYLMTSAVMGSLSGGLHPLCVI